VITALNLRDCTYVLANLREADRAELRGTYGDATGLDVAAICLSTPWAYQIKLQSVPVAIFGATPISATTVSAWAVGTGRFTRAVPALTRFINGPLAHDLRSHGFRWAEARSIATHEAAHRWLKGLGASSLATLSGYGPGGEDFILFRRALTV